MEAHRFATEKVYFSASYNPIELSSAKLRHRCY